MPPPTKTLYQLPLTTGRRADASSTSPVANKDHPIYRNDGTDREHGSLAKLIVCMCVRAGGSNKDNQQHTMPTGWYVTKMVRTTESDAQ